jgi:hypothetical protein
VTWAERAARIEELRERERDALEQLRLIRLQERHASLQLEEACQALVELGAAVDLPGGGL